jgi:hypothetical protein
MLAVKRLLTTWSDVLLVKVAVIDEDSLGEVALWEKRVNTLGFLYIMSTATR